MTLDQISEICNGLAWAKRANPFDVTIKVKLPFPFYQAVQRELIDKMSSTQVLADSKQMTREELETVRFTNIRFPSGINALIEESTDSIVFEPVTKELKVVHLQPDNGGGAFFKPGGQRA